MDSEEEDDYLFGGNRDVVRRRPRTFKARINFFLEDTTFCERFRFSRAEQRKFWDE